MFRNISVTVWIPKEFKFTYVDSAGVVRPIRFIRSLWKAVHDVVISFENNFFEDYILQWMCEVLR